MISAVGTLYYTARSGQQPGQATRLCWGPVPRLLARSQQFQVIARPGSTLRYAAAPGSLPRRDQLVYRAATPANQQPPASAAEDKQQQVHAAALAVLLHHQACALLIQLASVYSASHAAALGAAAHTAHTSKKRSPLEVEALAPPPAPRAAARAVLMTLLVLQGLLFNAPSPLKRLQLQQAAVIWPMVVNVPILSSMYKRSTGGDDQQQSFFFSTDSHTDNQEDEGGVIAEDAGGCAAASQPAPEASAAAVAGQVHGAAAVAIATAVSSSTAHHQQVVVVETWQRGGALVPAGARGPALLLGGAAVVLLAAAAFRRMSEVGAARAEARVARQAELQRRAEELASVRNVSFFTVLGVWGLRGWGR